jgi:hypothetical protein
MRCFGRYCHSHWMIGRWTKMKLLHCFQFIGGRMFRRIGCGTKPIKKFFTYRKRSIIIHNIYM